MKTTRVKRPLVGEKILIPSHPLRELFDAVRKRTKRDVLVAEQAVIGCWLWLVWERVR